MSKPLAGSFGLLALAFGLAATSGACAREAGGQGQETASDAAPAAPARVGFYAFDGTGMTAEKEGVLYQMYSRARVRTKAYFNGPDLSGSATRAIIERAKARVCEDWRRARIDSVSLAGYSRGAIIALAVARELLPPSSAGAKGGCANVDPDTAGTSTGPGMARASLHAPLFSFLGRGDSPKVTNLTLLDAVNTLNGDIDGDSLTAILSLSPSTRCFHFVKADRSEGPLGVLSTLPLPACETAAGPQGIRHQGLARLEEARGALEGKAATGDLVFEASPRLDSLAVADYRALCPLVTASSPGAGDGYSRCLKSLCQWEGPASGPGTCKAPTTLRAHFPESASTADETGPVPASP